MYLHELYNHLGLDKTNYARWAKNFLKDYEEGKDYVVEASHTRKKLYKFDTLNAIIILDIFSIDMNIIQEIISCSNHEFLRKMAPILTENNYQYFINQIIRLVAARNKDIPEGYCLPSLTPITYKMMRDLNIIDEDNEIINDGGEILLPRPIIKANGEINYHVIIKEALIDKLLLDYTELKALPEPPPKVEQAVIINNITRDDVVYDL